MQFQNVMSGGFTSDNLFKDQVTKNRVARDLSHDLQMKVVDGNRCARAAVDVLTLRLHHEKSKTSYLWHLSETNELC